MHRLLAVLLLVGCTAEPRNNHRKPDNSGATSNTANTPDDPPPDRPDVTLIRDEDPTVPTVMLDPVIDVSPWIGTVVTVSWTAPAGASSFVEYGLDGALDRVTPAVPGATPQVRVLGMTPESTWSLRAVTLVDAERLESEIIEVDLARLPDDVPIFQRTVVDPALSEMADKNVMVAILGLEDSWTVIVDAEGEVVWHHTSPPDVTIADPQTSIDQDGIQLIYIDRDRWDDVGRIERFGWDGGPVETTTTSLSHHAFIEHGDEQGFTWLSHEFTQWDPFGEIVDVMSERVLKGPRGSVDVNDHEVLFSWLDDQPLYIPCQHMEIPVNRYGHPDAHEWTHGNSLMYEPSTDSYLVGSRLHDSLIKIASDGSGAIWQMGGQNNQFTMLDPNGWWSHHHQSEWWPGGFLIFDNGVHKDPPLPRVAEYRYDEGAMTVELVWEYADPYSGPQLFLGDARRLAGGNILISWPISGNITEVTPMGDVVWEVRTDPMNILARMRVIADLYDPPPPW